MDNPAFGETGEGESGDATDATTQIDTNAEGLDSGGDGDGDATDSHADTGDGDGVADTGDGDAGDGDSGDGDSGDGDSGDGDSGDGDGDTSEPLCEDLIIPIVADTFVVNGPQEGDPGTCLLGWQWQGAPGEVCSHLNFGASEELWLGVEGNDQPGESLYLARFNIDALPAPGSVTSIESASFEFGIIALEGMPLDTHVQATLMTPGDGGYWVEGDLNGQEPADNAQVTTYKYQYYSSQTWPTNSPMPTIPYNLGDVDIGGLAGEHAVSIQLDLPTVTGWLANDPVAAFGNGIILSSNAPLFELLLPARENQEGQPTLELHLSVCY